MMRGMYAAISGLKNHQVMLDVTANDIANVNTIGYKSARTTFADSLTQVQRGASAPNTSNGGTNAAQIGLGVSLNSIDNLMGAGALQTTGNALDVAVQGEGFFRVGSAAPRRPRRRSSTPARATSRATRRATWSPGTAPTSSARPPTTARAPTPCCWSRPTPRASPSARTAASPTSRRAAATASPRATCPWRRSRTPPVSSAPPATAGSCPRTRRGELRHPGGNFGTTTAGALEMSNVDLATTFTNMITAQRGFQANSRVISTADEMLQDLVNLKR